MEVIITMTALLSGCSTKSDIIKIQIRGCKNEK